MHLTFRPNPDRNCHWNNESTPLQVWITNDVDWDVQPSLLEFANGAQAESDEPRRLDFEVRPPALLQGMQELHGYAVYNVCEQTGGRCLFLRQDFTIKFDIERPTN